MQPAENTTTRGNRAQAPHGTSLRGPAVVLLIFGLALAAAGFAWWYRQSLGQRVVDHWGGQAGMRIRYAPSVELLRVRDEPSNLGAPLATQGDPPQYLENPRDVSRAKGIQNARQALVEDASYDWNVRNQATAPRWAYALFFRDRDGLSRLLIDAECRTLWLVEGKNGPICSAPIAHALQAFLEEQYAAAPKGTQAP